MNNNPPSVSKTEKQKVDEIRNRKIMILVVSIIACIAMVFGAIYYVNEQKKAKEIELSRTGVITGIAQDIAEKFNDGIEWASFSLWDISDQEDLDDGAPLYRLSYSGSYSGEVDVYGQYDDGRVDVWSVSVYINSPNNDAAAAANLYALAMNIFYNVERYGTEFDIREEIAYSSDWENRDMYFSSEDGYSVTINLGVLPDGEWDGQIWSGL